MEKQNISHTVKMPSRMKFAGFLREMLREQTNAPWMASAKMTQLTAKRVMSLDFIVSSKLGLVLVIVIAAVVNTNYTESMPKTF